MSGISPVTVSSPRPTTLRSIDPSKNVTTTEPSPESKPLQGPADSFRTADSADAGVSVTEGSQQRSAASFREQRRASRRALAAAPRPTDLLDPAPMAREAAGVAAGMVKTQRADGELFVNGPGVDDAIQGVIGNCYFVAAMAAVAGVSPQQIQDRMRQNPDGTVSVKFSAFDQDGKKTDQEVRVDRDMLVQADGPGAGQAVYGASTEKDAAGRQEAWVPMMEKAYAQMNGGFEKIGNGGSSAVALEALTGVKAKAQLIGVKGDLEEKPMMQLARLVQSSRDAGWNFLNEAAGKKNPIVAQSYCLPDMMKSGILPMHAYSVTAVEEKDGQRMVTVRNPAPYRPELDDPKLQDEFAKDPMYGPLVQYLRDNKISAKDMKWGTFTMPYAEFEKTFSCAFAAPVNG